jgi:hypothetical protein
MPCKSEINDFDFLDGVVGPEDHGMLSDDHDLQQSSNVITFNVIAFQEWVMAKFPE